MRIAIVSDIHGNIEALKKLPADYDELWVLGDLVDYGPNPAEVVEFVRTRASMVVRGNHDDFVATGNDPRCSAPYRRMAEETMRYTRSVLSPDQIEYLAKLPLTAQRAIGDTTFFLCHATPSDPLYTYLRKDDSEWEPEVIRASSDFLLVGHTHVPFTRPAGMSIVVNPGSLGQPKTGSTMASYAIWDDGIELKSYDYDLEETLHAVERMPIPLTVRRDLLAVLLSGGSVNRAAGTKVPD